MKVLLARPAYSQLYQLITSKTKEKHVVPPMGLLYVGAALEGDGHQVEVIDGEPDDLTPEEILRRIKLGKPDIVGAGATTVDFEYANSLLRLVKDELNVTTVLGGVHGTVLPNQVLEENPHIDFVVRGEGEITTKELLKEMEGNKDFSQVEGVSYRENGRVINNEDRSPINDLNGNPLPARHLLDQNKYIFPVPRKGMRAMAAMQTSRGCPYQCNYCYRMFGQMVRFREPTLVVDEIENCVDNYGIEWISFIDDTFTLNQKRVIEICEEIIRRKLGVFWICLARADSLEEGMLRKMKEAGCKQISIGVESGNQEILDRARKGEKLEQFMQAYELLKEVGFETRGSFILGLAYENTKTLRDTIDFAKHLKLDRAFFNVCIPYPGTALFEMAEKGEGLRLLSHSWKDFKRWGDSVIELEDVPRKKLIEWQRIAMMEFYARPKIIWWHIKEFIKGEHAKYYYRPLLFGLGEFYRRKLKIFNRNHNEE